MKIIVRMLILFALVCINGFAFGDEAGDNTNRTEKSVSDPLIVGEMFFDKKDYTLALKWYLEAASKDNPVAQNRIGEMYMEGQGVKQDYLTASSWFVKAAAKRYGPAQFNLGVLYENGLGIIKNYTYALGLYVQAARQGNVAANYKAGYFYQNGLGTDKNLKYAIPFYKMAAEAGNVDAILALGSNCLNGLDGDVDYKSARTWFKMAADKGSPFAQNMLGLIYKNGWGTQQDYHEAIRWFEIAAHNGNEEAKTNLAIIEKNNLNSPDSFIKAATDGDPSAMYNLGIMYDNGVGTAVDHVKAMEWLIKAAKKKSGSREVEKLEILLKLYMDDFMSLEKIGRMYRDKKTKTESGFWQLESFYDVLSEPAGKNKKTEERWRYHLEKIEKWKKSFPKSVMPCILMGQSYYKYAWEARGTGYANEVSEDGWSGFRDSLKRAEDILSEAKSMPEKCPQWFLVAMRLSVSQGWDVARFNDLFYSAIKYEPTYDAFYKTKILYLSPKWYGNEGDDVAFAEEVEKFVGGKEGLALYSHLMWSACSNSGNAFKFMQRNLASWDKLKRGFQCREELFGKNLFDLNRFCYMAVFAGDKDTSRRLFARIGNNWEESVFGTKNNFDFHKSSVAK